MTISPRNSLLASVVALLFVATACGPKDAEINTAVNQAIAGVPGITVNVEKGVATIAGEYADSAAKVSTAATVKGVKGVTSVVDNATVTPAVVISPDEALRSNVASALNEWSTLSANVQDGVVTLTGEIKRSELPKAMQALSALQPKQIVNNATLTK